MQNIDEKAVKALTRMPTANQNAVSHMHQSGRLSGHHVKVASERILFTQPRVTPEHEHRLQRLYFC